MAGFDSSLFLLIIGLLIGSLGTLVGAGGGFILVPILLLLYPHRTPNEITAISLTVVFLNALSGTIAYAQQKRIDYRAGIIFSLFAIPGSLIGAWGTSYLPRAIFEPIIASFLIAMGIFLVIRPTKLSVTTESKPYSMKVGALISVFVGFLSSLLGIGGGIIHVPALVHLLSFSVHTATATSHFILAIVALFGAGVHLFSGDLRTGVHEIMWLGPGVIVGARIGAILSHRIKGSIIIRSLAVALVFVGLRIWFR